MNSSPHIHCENSTDKIMADVLISLLPAVIMSIFFFGIRAAFVEAVCTFSSFIGEAVLKSLKKEKAPFDFSSPLSGLLLSLTLPGTVPIFVAALGGFFAAFVVKGLCGGLGKNVFNPALGARAALLFAFPLYMTNYHLDAITSATPLHQMQAGVLPDFSLWNMFIGKIGGSLGEVSSLAIILGGIYLTYRRVIDVRIPIFYVGTVALLSLIFNEGYPFLWCAYNVLGGGLLFGAVFMATDYSSSPVTAKGRLLFAIALGCLTMLFRYTGIFPEGVTYAILFMNGLSTLIEEKTLPTRFGSVKGAKNESCR